MKPLVAATAMVIALASPARAEERFGDAALGALSGGLVFGPVGLVAGAVVGYAAGPTISRSWRADRHRPRAHVAKPRAQVAASTAKSRKAARRPGDVAPAAGTGGPPPQGFE